MRIAIIGAGFAGLCTAKVLREHGFDVVVHEKAPDVGGVWSATRRYPGLTTQNDKGTYAFSDHPMPRDYPEWPSGEQVQAYLESYVDRFALGDVLRLGSEVVVAEPVRGLPPRPTGLPADDDAVVVLGWDVTTHDIATGEIATERVDHLVVANGIFCEPHVPDFPGREEFEAAGGRLLDTTELHTLPEAEGRRVVVVGYGKSACDVAVPVSDVASSTTVVARNLLWKMPARLGGRLNYKYLLLTRLGEGLFRYVDPVGVERLIHGPLAGTRDAVLDQVQAMVTGQLRLEELGLVPPGPFENIARANVSLVTEGFFERVASGRIGVVRDRAVARLLDKDGPCVELDDGSVLPADVVVCGTGFRQSVPFLPADVQELVTDRRGNFRLYRQIHPVRVSGLSFAGYNSSLFSPLSAEVGAAWIAGTLTGLLRLPPDILMDNAIDRRLVWMEERTDGRHARGTNIIPFSMHNIDELLRDLHAPVGWATRLREWALPVRPGAYRRVLRRLRKRSEKLRRSEARRAPAGRELASGVSLWAE